MEEKDCLKTDNVLETPDTNVVPSSRTESAEPSVADSASESVVPVSASEPVNPDFAPESVSQATVAVPTVVLSAAAPDAEPAETAARPDYAAEITAIIRSSISPKAMSLKLEDYHANDIADVLAHLTEAERKKLYRVLDTDFLAEILEYAEREDAGTYLTEMDVRKAAVVAGHMESDAALEILREIEKSRRSLIISCMDEETRRDLTLLSSFDEDEIGSRMTTNHIVLRENLTVKQAMRELTRQAPDNDNISTLFVVDENGYYYGAVDLKELIIARYDASFADLIMTSYPYVYGHEDIDDCIEKLKDYSEDLIPVLDNENHLLGVITSQSVIQVVDDAMSEDYAKLAGLAAEEDLTEPLRESMKKRLPWLFILLGLGMVVSTVVGMFEPVVSQLTLIMAFQSLILDMAGNVGTQSLAVTIRVLMDESLTGSQKLGLVWKEIRVGFSNGLLLGIASFAALGVYIVVFKGYGGATAFAISACIGAALLAAMVISSAVGTLVPLFFHRISVDPAVASGPLITTMNDLVAVVTYYGLSWLLLLKVMHLAG